MFFDSWYGLRRVLVVGTIAYCALVILLRVSSKRTLAKLNAFDLIVTVALGSTLATVLLSKSVALVEGLAAFALLAGLQYVVAWLSIRSPRFNNLVKSEPTFLVHHVRFLKSAMCAQAVTRAEFLAALRSAGAANPEQGEAVVLETDGSLTVIQGAGAAGAIGTLEGTAEPMAQPASRAATLAGSGSVGTADGPSVGDRR